jgi:hypothetical protein
MKNTIEINGEIYVKQSDPSSAVLLRTKSAGVHVGELVSRSGQEASLRNAVRIWRWQGANTLHEISLSGIDSAATSGYTRVSDPVDEITVLEVIEVIPVSEVALASIRSAGWAS